jgi:hypothetical protein
MILIHVQTRRKYEQTRRIHGETRRKHGECTVKHGEYTVKHGKTRRIHGISTVLVRRKKTGKMGGGRLKIDRTP